MIVCLVTDRRRRSPIEQVKEAAAAGVDIVQIRERDLEAGELAALVSAVIQVTRGSSTRVVVNDRLDVAVGCGADGVHLRSDSIPADRVRRMTADGFLIGRSIHSADETRAAAGSDYLLAGTVFPTASKPGQTTWLGLEGLSAIAKASPAPVLAIGGMSVDRAPEVARAGAAGIAAIGLFTQPDLPIKEIVRLLREGFNIGGKKIPRP